MVCKVLIVCITASKQKQNKELVVRDALSSFAFSVAERIGMGGQCGVVKTVLAWIQIPLSLKSAR